MQEQNIVKFPVLRACRTHGAAQRTDLEERLDAVSEALRRDAAVETLHLAVVQPLVGALAARVDVFDRVVQLIVSALKSGVSFHICTFQVVEGDVFLDCLLTPSNAKMGFLASLISRA